VASRARSEEAVVAILAHRERQQQRLSRAGQGRCGGGFRAPWFTGFRSSVRLLSLSIPHRILLVGFSASHLFHVDSLENAGRIVLSFYCILLAICSDIEQGCRGVLFRRQPYFDASNGAMICLLVYT